MIKKISKIKNFGVFQDFKWDTSTIPDFNKHNLFYGWNYSGKTTISRLFRCFELGEKHTDYPDAEFELEDDQNPSKKYNDKDLSTLPHVRVFNTDFILKNLKWYSLDDKGIEPILFSIGNENINLQQQLEKLRVDQKALSDEKTKLSDKKTELETGVETAFTQKARDIKNTLSIPNYDKDRFKPSVEAIINDFAKHLLDVTDYNKHLTTYKNTEQRNDVILNTFPTLNFSDLQNKAKEIMERKITAQKIIEELKNNENLNKWVNEGRGLHKGKNKCSFCGNDLPADLFQKLDQHFSTEYEKLEKDLQGLISIIETHKTAISGFVLPANGEFYKEFVSDYEKLQKEFNVYIKKYCENIDELSKNLKSKKAKPFDEHKFTELPDNSSKIKDKHDEIKSVVNKHKNKTENFEKEKNEAKENLIKHSSAQFIQDQKYPNVLQEQKDIAEKITTNKASLDKVANDIVGVEKQLSESVKGAEEINKYIQQFFRHDGIKIEVTDDNRFKMSRNGEPAKNLSEGEKTAISLAYFIAGLEDIKTKLDKTIVFIDDPVSSLDCNHLFNIYAFIKSKMANCSQLFVSTHNLEFFNLMKDFIKYDCKGSNGKGYGNCMPCYLIEKVRNEKNDKNGQSFVKDLPSTLKKFKTEYNYLFSLLKKAHDQKIDELELFEILYLLPNITRRFLEGYFGLRYPNGKKLETKIDDINFFKKEDKEKLLKILDEYSHEESVEHALKFPDASEIKEIISIVFAGLKDKDQGHYDALCESCN